MHRILMCPPDYYGIEYEINPWMRREHPPDHALAQAQWRDLHEIIISMPEVSVELIEPVSGLPDMVFTANAGLVKDNLFISSRFRFPQREGESEHFEKWFAGHDYVVDRLPDELKFEGAGDVLRAGGTWYGGYYFRSAPLAHADVSELLGEEVIPLRLTDGRFYHLDTCFLPVGDSLVYYPGAFDDYSLAVIKDRFPDAIEVNSAEAALFACNSVVIGNWVIMNAGSPRLCSQLTALGYDCVTTDLSEFLKAGGAAKCLTLEI